MVYAAERETHAYCFKDVLLNFPLYLACKHSALSRLYDLSAQEISNLSSYCDLHDIEIPAYLLRNVSLFCKLGGVCAMTSVFEHATPSNFPLSMVHSIVAAVGNLKLLLNFRAVAQLFMPLRSNILQYMCSLEDKDLRLPAVKSMADFMWGAAKEPLDAPLPFDSDGLALAFKYFNSSTLTMRFTSCRVQVNLLVWSRPFTELNGTSRLTVTFISITNIAVDGKPWPQRRVRLYI